MFKNKVALILGAGASYEVGLPIGDTLKEQISEALHVRQISGGWGDFHLGDSTIEDVIKRLISTGGSDFQRGELVAACKGISSALPLARSIDNYLHSHKASKATELCGKLGIVNCILKAENASRLKIDEDRSANARVDFSELAGSWYNRFAALMFESSFDDLKKALQNLSVIAFNYDRCFEHFMYYSIITYYGCEPQVAADVVKSMNIYHPYGTVGYLPWMGKSPTAKFGEVVDSSVLLSLAGQIKTYTEGVERNSSDIQAIHNAMRKASNVIFLGFGYIPLNMDLLRPDGDPNWTKNNAMQKQYWGTAYGLSEEDNSLVANRVKGLIQANGAHAKINNKLKCADLFTEYGFTLSAL